MANETKNMAGCDKLVFFQASLQTLELLAVQPQTTNLMTGTDWEIHFHMDELTSFRYLWITCSQFDYFTDILKQQHPNQNHQAASPPEIPLTQKVALFL